VNAGERSLSRVRHDDRRSESDDPTVLFFETHTIDRTAEEVRPAEARNNRTSKMRLEIRGAARELL